MGFYGRRQQIMIGMSGKVRVFQLNNGEDIPLGGEVVESKSFSSAEHTDIVRCVVACEGRFYSGGYVLPGTP